MTYSKDEIFSTLKSITDHLINNTKKYLSKFDTNDAFSFSNNEETRKNHQNVFNKFKVALKNDIEKYGIKEFNENCRASVFEYESLWREMTKRMAYLIDLDNPYITLDNDYIETEWWI